jgi:hypothetical protein
MESGGVRTGRRTYTGGDSSQSRSHTAPQKTHKLEPYTARLAIELNRGKDAGRDEGERVTLPTRAKWLARRETDRSRWTCPFARRELRAHVPARQDTGHGRLVLCSAEPPAPRQGSSWTSRPYLSGRCPGGNGVQLSSRRFRASRCINSASRRQNFTQAASGNRHGCANTVVVNPRFLPCSSEANPKTSHGSAAVCPRPDGSRLESAIHFDYHLACVAPSSASTPDQQEAK